jgi:carbonic anhydrase
VWKLPLAAVAAAGLVTGCKYIDQPKKTAELEKRLDEVSEVLTKMAGKPVGKRKDKERDKDKDDDEAADEDGDKDAADKDGDKPSKRSKDDHKSSKHHEDEHASEAGDDKGKEPGGPLREDKPERPEGDEDNKPRKLIGAAEGDKAEGDKAEGDKAEGDKAEGDAKPDKGDKGDKGDKADAKVAKGAKADKADKADKGPRKPDGLWGYLGAGGPSKWANLDPAFEACGGKSQSPIDILPRRGSAPEAFFVYQAGAATVVEGDHTATVDIPGGSFSIIDGKRYELERIRVRTPSEHTIAGDRYPMELQLQHRGKDGKLVMVSVLVSDGEPSAAMAPVWKALPKPGVPAKLKKFDPALLLPKDHAAFRYEGSLTSPPCTEGVTWYVMKRPRTESEANIAVFQQHFGDNARPVQDSGEREVK